MGAVEEIHLIGDYANGRDTGTVEIIIIVQNSNADYLKRLQIKLNKLIERTVLFYINRKIPQNGIVLYKQSNLTLT
jgi:hypothetical protein